MKKCVYLLSSIVPLLLVSCHKDDDEYQPVDPFANTKAAFGDNIDPDNLYNYAGQTVPGYITKDNSGANPITDKGATLGRVLFYDVNLSSDNTVSCASCHKQEHAFSDTDVASTGVNGTTARHTMRLINTRFSAETHFFWDERAVSLEQQTTMPVRNHGEMGFSGENGDQSFDDLIVKLGNIGYYKELFTWVYGTEEITEEKIQKALAQFVRSIQSFDSKYDAGRAVAGNDGPPFANFTQQENQGKDLFLRPPVFNQNGQRINGGVGCAGCHRIPEFDIDPAAKNNGLIATLRGIGTDMGNTRAPSLRNLVKADGTLNGPLMHTGQFATLEDAIAHYNVITADGNTNIDPRLIPGGNGQKLNMTQQEVSALVAFLKTLDGANVYTDVKWGNPFK
ncbi:cytochrome-c peroxidase [Flavobacterium album]|uniref:Cytochrome-c peroxidase n=1 Tax=Flavobacterium album TaxID=2175091 RepID=A0A2S1R1I7_9FLAO|nr:cytochrome c peroxidase [Flavobacterium album]AWH86472.1 cytochrome-c peroxidase [Flavobacterium album]